MRYKMNKEDIILKNLVKLNKTLTRNNILELAELLGNKRKLLVRNLITGISKGIGIGIGFTILTAIIVKKLQKIVTLNIPVIGEYIADIVEIVERSK